MTTSHSGRHKTRRLFTLELRGQEVDFECHITGADPDVGIMSADFEDEVITGDSGVLDWELTDAEREQVNRHISECDAADAEQYWERRE